MAATRLVRQACARQVQRKPAPDPEVAKADSSVRRTEELGVLVTAAAKSVVQVVVQVARLTVECRVSRVGPVPSRRLCRRGAERRQPRVEALRAGLVAELAQLAETPVQP